MSSETTKRIADITQDHLGDNANALDVIAFRAACRSYQEMESCTEAEAIDAIYGDGDFWAQVEMWAPREAELALTAA